MKKALMVCIVALLVAGCAIAKRVRGYLPSDISDFLAVKEHRTAAIALALAGGSPGTVVGVAEICITCHVSLTDNVEQGAS